MYCQFSQFLSYDPADFTFVSATAGSGFSSAFPDTNANGAVTFTAGIRHSCHDNQTVAVITLQATGIGSSAISLAQCLFYTDFTSDCSAAWDSVTSDNDLGSISSPSNITISGGTTSTDTATLSLSPNTQSVTSGSDIVVTVALSAGTASVLSVQSILTYNPADFTFVSAAQGSAFAAAFPYTTASGSVTFTAASTTPVTTDQTVAVITLQATGAGGTSAVSLADVCPSGNVTATCSAAWDSTTSDNDLASVAGANYTVTPSTTPTCPTGDTGTYPDCVAPTCPSGDTGTYPDCVAPTCPSGDSGTYPDCVAPSGSSTSGTPPSSYLGDNYGDGGSDTNTYTNPSEVPSYVPTPTVPAPTSTPLGGSSTNTTPTSSTISTYTISVQVLNSSKQPVVGAIVDLNGEKATTNSKGIATLVAEAGQYKIGVSGKGIKPYKSSITVQASTGTQQFEAYVKPSSSVSGALIVIILIVIIVIVAGLYVWMKMKGKLKGGGKSGPIGSSPSGQPTISPTVVSPGGSSSSTIVVPKLDSDSKTVSSETISSKPPSSTLKTHIG